MLNMIKNFKNDESGAVTVDWVVLTAAVVGLALLVIGQVGDAVELAGESIATSITDSAGVEGEE